MGSAVQVDSSRLSYSMAEEQDLPGVAQLLASHDLPTADLNCQVQHFLIVKDQGAVIAVAGVEIHGADALLRSLCVQSAYRSLGVASRACDLLEAYARNLGARQFYLLTNTAEEFFRRRGFATCSREATPPAIRETAEFRSLCPASATCMTRSLATDANYLPKSLLPLRADLPGSRMWAVNLRDTSLTYFEVDPATRFDAHAHEGEQITTVVDGELFFELESRTVRIGAGEAIAIPSGVSHAVFTLERAAKAFDAWSPPPQRYR